MSGKRNVSVCIGHELANALYVTLDATEFYVIKVLNHEAQTSFGTKMWPRWYKFSSKTEFHSVLLAFRAKAGYIRKNTS